MQIAERRRDGLWLLAPMTMFLLLLLGFPLVLDLIYSVSKVGFETLRSPEIIGFGNYRKAVADPEFWAAAWFSLRFGIIVATVQVLLGLGLAIFLAPLLDARPWLMAILMLPMMVAPALVGLMYRLVLHEFVGVVPYYLYLWNGDSPSFLGATHRVPHAGDHRDPAVDAVRPPHPLHCLRGDPEVHPRGGGA